MECQMLQIEHSRCAGMNITELSVALAQRHFCLLQGVLWRWKKIPHASFLKVFFSSGAWKKFLFVNDWYEMLKTSDGLPQAQNGNLMQPLRKMHIAQ